MAVAAASAVRAAGARLPAARALRAGARTARGAGAGPFAGPCAGLASAAEGRQPRRGPRVLAIGNTIIDTVLSVPYIPLDDKVWINSKQTFVGGQGANAAQGMAKLGLDVAFVTRLGDDKDGVWAEEHYRQEGMDTTHCIMVPGAHTMSACVTLTKDTRCCYMHSDARLFDVDIESRLSGIDVSAFDVVYTDGHQLDMALPLARRAAALGVPVVADVEVLHEGSRELSELAMELVAPGKTLRELAKCDDPGDAAVRLADRPGKVVIATEGDRGSFGAQHGDRCALHVPADSRCEAFDTLGAGDAFHAGYTAALAWAGHDLRARMEFATAVAAALCETPGPVVSLEALARYGIRPGQLGSA